MDFFEAQDAARSRTRTLVALYLVAVIAIIIAVYAVVHVALGPGPQAGIDPALLLGVALLVGVLIGIGSAVRTVQLRQGGGKVAELLGGRRVRSNTTDEAERRLVNVVEEMAIASGTPMPAIYVLDHESGINAFAAGYTVDDAAVAVTRGTLERLNRDELQGVIAHEFSHILNGDMRLNIRLMGLLFGILLLAVVGRGLLHTGGRGRRRDGGGQIALVGLALLVVGYIGVFFGRLIQAAVSRQREYLADAAAVQFTRDPSGIAGALAKIGGIGSRLEDHHAQEASHLFFANGLGSAFTTMLATHPPLEDRIRRLQPGAAVDAASRGAPSRGAPSRAAPAGVSGFAPSAAEPARGGSAAGGELIASVGAPRPQHVAYASRLLQSLPADVLAAAHDPAQAVALLFALLLVDEAAAAQQHIIEQSPWPAAAATAQSLAPQLRAAGAHARLPILDVLLPALRELSPAEGRQLYDTAQRLVEADGRVDMFELALLHVVRRHVATDRTDYRPQSGPQAVQELADEAAILLSAVAWSGATRESAAQEAFAAGAANLQPGIRTLALLPRDRLDVARIDAALGRARTSSAAVRRRLLESCMLGVAHDGRVQTEEAEMLRAVAEAIDLPMPPVLG
jgi:Zn-dependent protease with chaperone function